MKEVWQCKRDWRNQIHRMLSIDQKNLKQVFDEAIRVVLFPTESSEQKKILEVDAISFETKMKKIKNV